MYPFSSHLLLMHDLVEDSVMYTMRVQLQEELNKIDDKDHSK